MTIWAIASPPFAHETWFVSDNHGADWSFAGESLTLGLLAAACAGHIRRCARGSRLSGRGAGASASQERPQPSQ